MTLKSIEEQIKAARERGDFDNLPGRGKPLDHSRYFSRPEHLRVTHHLLEQAGFVPREVELQREIGELRERLAAATSEAERVELQREITRRRAELEVMLARQHK